MNSLKSLKMKKVKDFLTSEKDIRKVRVALLKKTERDFLEFAHSKQNMREIAHNKHFD